MARLKKRKKSGKRRSGSGSGPRVRKKVRLPRDEVMHVQRMDKGGDAASAKRALLAFHPGLTPRELDELLRRIRDPQGMGGIETGHDPDFGDYADIAITD